jgi:4-hydroxy-3-methylbut-2-enyl diphosphate reductase
MLLEQGSEIDWREFENIRSLGVTAGASAPEVLVDSIIDAFAERFDVSIETVTTAEETISFKLPRPLRDSTAA